jgi:hypothetical protein
MVVRPSIGIAFRLSGRLELLVPWQATFVRVQKTQDLAADTFNNVADVCEQYDFSAAGNSSEKSGNRRVGNH